MDTPSISYSQQIAEVQFEKDTVDSTREMTFIIASEATGKKHRNKFLYNWDSWVLDNYNSNGIVGYQHNVYGDAMCAGPNPDDVIAKSEAWIDTYKGKKNLIAKGTFEPEEINETAEKVFQKLKWGSLKAVSTGVMPVGKIVSETEKNSEGDVINRFLNFKDGQELLEWSVVNIPADPAAMRRSMKSHTMAAMSFVQRLMEDLSISDIKSMKVQDVLDAIDGKYKSAPLEEIEQELSGPDPNLDKYISTLNKIKNGSLKRS